MDWKSGGERLEVVGNEGGRYWVVRRDGKESGLNTVAVDLGTHFNILLGAPW